MAHPASVPVSCRVFVAQPTQALPALPLAQPASIRPATVADLKFILDVQRRFTDAVGFLPRMAIEWYAEHAGIVIAQENDAAAGYLLGRARLRWNPLIRPIYQAAVLMDARRRHHGLALLELVERNALAAGQLAIQANCAADLEANEFWKAAGFKPIAHLTPDNTRGRDVICWRKPLTRRIPPWFIDLPARAGHRAQRPASIRSERHQSASK